MHAALLSEVFIAGMVVDGQIDLVLQVFRVVGKQAQRCKVHGDYRVKAAVILGPQRVHIGRKDLGRLGVAQQKRALAQAAQHMTQRRRAAQRVSVGPLMGQDQIVVMLAEKVRDFRRREHQSLSSSTMSALAGLAGLTTFGSRSISRMCAPYSMESSATNCSSGV